MKRFFFVFGRRDKATLIPIIEKEILPGRTIISDEWKPYKVLENKGYNHLTVNHSKNCVDSLTGDNTQTIEYFKMKILRKITSELIHSHLIEAGGGQLILKMLFLNVLVYRYLEFSL